MIIRNGYITSISFHSIREFLDTNDTTAFHSGSLSAKLPKWMSTAVKLRWVLKGTLGPQKVQGFLAKTKLGGGNSNNVYFHPFLGKWSNLTHIFRRGWNHQLEKKIRKEESKTCRLVLTLVVGWLFNCSHFLEFSFFDQPIWSDLFGVWSKPILGKDRWEIRGSPLLKKRDGIERKETSPRSFCGVLFPKKTWHLRGWWSRAYIYYHILIWLDVLSWWIGSFGIRYTEF